MQIRQASIPADSLPPCPHCHGEQSCLQKHGCYERYTHPDSADTTRIPRFLCKFTNKTVSVLPDGFLPYRSLPVPDVQAHFDQLADISQPDTQQETPPPSQTIKKGLERAWNRFTDADRIASIKAHFGQQLPLTDSPRLLWRTLRQSVGTLSHLLLELATQGKSLLGDYQCLKPS